LETTPYRTFFFGLAATVATVLVVSLLSAVTLALAKFVGALLAVAALGVATVGAAGTASAMAARLLRATAGAQSRAAAYVRGAIGLELAAAFPIVGWFVVLPLCLTASYGAGLFSLLRWMPRAALSPTAEPALGSA
jgi:hypothetical protein